MGDVILEESGSHPFPGLLKLVYNTLPADQKTAVQALDGIHHSGIVMPLLLVLGEINAAEYVKGLISLKIQPKEFYPEILAGVAGVQAYSGFTLQKPGREKQASELLPRGEGDAIEFKSTLR